MKLTNKELLDFVQVAQQYEARRDSEHIRSKGEGRKITKFDYALNKVLKKANRLVEKFTEKQQGINIDLCEEDDKAVILRDERGDLKFKKQALRDRNAKFQELGDEEIEIEPHLVKTVPPDLTIKERLAFEGLIFDEAEPEDVKQEVK